MVIGMGASTNTTRAVVYARKSTEDKARAGKSVRDQLKDAVAEVDRRGWQLMGEFSDDGISASRHARSKRRPGFDQVLSMIEHREVDAVVMAEQSRATRSLAVLGALLESCADNGVVIVVGGSEVDPGNPDGFLLSAITGAVDATESERTRKRTLRGLRHAAAEGKPPGRIPFGYTRRYDPDTRAFISQDINPPEADLIRRLVREVLAGRSLRSICLDLDAEGIPTPAAIRNPRATFNGHRVTSGWTQPTVRRLVLSPTIAGHRVHQGEVIGKGQWEPIVSEADWQAVVRLLSDPTRKTVRPGGLRHLLSGIATCGECGSGMRTRKNRGIYKSYTCITPGCMKVTIKQEWADEYVTAGVLERLRSPVFAEAMASTSTDDYAAARVELEQLRARQADIGAAMASGALSLAAGQAADKALTADIAAADGRLRAAASGSPVLSAMAGGDPDALWEHMDVEQRAAVVRALVRPVINRGKSGSRTFDPKRITLEWLQ